MNYTQKTISALSWTTVLRGLFRVVTFLKIAVLARILSPEQFGYFGIIALTLAFLEILTETGINPFLIAVEKISPYVNSAWILSLIRGLLISSGMFFLAGPISLFFASPRTFALLQLAALIPLVRGVINPSCVLLVKELNFKAEFIYRSSIILVEVALAIALAFSLKSPMALILAMIVSAFWEVLISFAFLSPRPKFQLDTHKIRVIISHGKWVTGFGILEYLFTNLDNIVVGRLLGPVSLGLYQNAYKISTLPLGEVNDIIYKTSFPLYSHMLAESYPKIKSTVLTITFVSTLVMLCLGISIFLFSETVVLLLLGPSWTEAIPAVKTLAFLGVVKGVSYSFNAVFMSKKKQHLVTLITFCSVLGLTVTIIPLVNRFGIVGAGLSALIGAVLSLPIALHLISKELKSSP